MKVRQDLPTRVSSRYSAGFIKICDKYRKKYKTGVKISELLFNSDNSRIPEDTETYRSSLGSSQHFMALVEFGNPVSQLLKRLSPDYTQLVEYKNSKTGQKSTGYGYYFPRSCDITTAIYVPQYINSVSLMIKKGRVTLVFPLLENEDTIDLDLVLSESKTVPCALKSTESILRDSRDPEHVPVHLYPDQLNLNNQIYKRVKLMDPYYPVKQSWMMVVFFVLPEKCTIYLENSMISLELPKTYPQFHNNNPFVGLFKSSTPYLLYINKENKITIFDKEGKIVDGDTTEYNFMDLVEDPIMPQPPCFENHDTVPYKGLAQDAPVPRYII